MAATLNGYTYAQLGDIAAHAAGRPPVLEEAASDNSMPSEAAAAADDEDDGDEGSTGAPESSFIRIENIVVKTSVGAKLNLNDVAMRGRHLGFQYNPHRFAAIIRSGRSPSSSFLGFGTGKVVCAGCTRVSDARFVVASTIEDIKSLHPCYSHLRLGAVEVVNIVGHTKLPYAVRLDDLAAENAHVTYTPDDFEGAIIRHPDVISRAGMASMSVLCFRHGDLVITGGTRPSHLHCAYRIVCADLARYAVVSVQRKRTSRLEQRRRTKKRCLAAVDMRARPDRYIALDANSVADALPTNNAELALQPATAAERTVATTLARDDAELRRMHAASRNALALLSVADTEMQERAAAQRDAAGAGRMRIIDDEEARYMRQE